MALVSKAQPTAPVSDEEPAAPAIKAEPAASADEAEAASVEEVAPAVEAKDAKPSVTPVPSAHAAFDSTVGLVRWHDSIMLCCVGTDWAGLHMSTGSDLAAGAGQ